MANIVDEETYESSFSDQTFSINLTDGSVFALIPNGDSEKVAFSDRFKFIDLAVRARMAESDAQIAAVKRGLCKMIPYSLIKCKLH
jgi:E3 ubiquitin-protein ligase HECTD3